MDFVAEELIKELEQVWREIDAYLADKDMPLEDRAELYCRATGDEFFTDDPKKIEEYIDEWVASGQNNS